MLLHKETSLETCAYETLKLSSIGEEFKSAQFVGFKRPSDWVGVLSSSNADFIKASKKIEIQECHEPLVEIPSDILSVEKQHPYVLAGAPYGVRSPFVIRKSILDKLFIAQVYLNKYFPGARIHIFDGYRPVGVQAYMVEKTFDETLNKMGHSRETASESEKKIAWDRVLSVWALPSTDLSTPPPHSTGGVVDVGLVDLDGKLFNIGCNFDDEPPAALPFHYHFIDPTEETTEVVRNREFLFDAMRFAGFQRLPHEPWHFSYGDQVWAYLEAIDRSVPIGDIKALYGRID